MENGIVLNKKIKELRFSNHIDISLSKNLYYLGVFMTRICLISQNPNDSWCIENLSDDQIDDFYLRFTLIMRSFWGELDTNYEEFLFMENPLYYI